MITHTNDRLPLYQVLGHTLRINFDEKSLSIEHFGEIQNTYQYQTALVEVGASRSDIIEAVISCKYSPGAEIAAINNAVAAPEAYAQYQAFRVQAKNLADGLSQAVLEEAKQVALEATLLRSTPPVIEVDPLLEVIDAPPIEGTL